MDIIYQSLSHQSLPISPYHIMADNYLERHREEYEQRKQAWLKKKKHIPKAKQKASANRSIEKPDDEAL